MSTRWAENEKLESHTFLPFAWLFSYFFKCFSAWVIRRSQGGFWWSHDCVESNEREEEGKKLEDEENSGHLPHYRWWSWLRRATIKGLAQEVNKFTQSDIHIFFESYSVKNWPNFMPHKFILINCYLDSLCFMASNNVHVKTYISWLRFVRSNLLQKFLPPSVSRIHSNKTADGGAH